MTRPEAATARGAFVRTGTTTDGGFEVAVGNYVATFTAPASSAWNVYRIVVQAYEAGRALVYNGPQAPENLAVRLAGGYESHCPPAGHFVPEGGSLTIVWDNGGAGFTELDGFSAWTLARIEYVEV